jgi:hypothetical protein
MDDIHTDQVAEKIARKINCWAVINRLYRKPRGGQYPNLQEYCLDLNRIDHAVIHPTYLDTIFHIVTSYPHILIVWLHGIKDQNLANEFEVLDYYTRNNSRRVHGIVGYGQGPHPRIAQSRSAFTARPDTVKGFCQRLFSEGLNVFAGSELLSNYRGRHQGCMNQWFRIQGYSLAQVESVQLELGNKGIRTPKYLDNTALAIARALRAII